MRELLASGLSAAEAAAAGAGGRAGGPCACGCGGVRTRAARGARSLRRDGRPARPGPDVRGGGRGRGAARRRDPVPARARRALGGGAGDGRPGALRQQRDPGPPARAGARLGSGHRAARGAGLPAGGAPRDRADLLRPQSPHTRMADHLPRRRHTRSEHRDQPVGRPAGGHGGGGRQQRALPGVERRARPCGAEDPESRLPARGPMQPRRSASARAISTATRWMARPRSPHRPTAPAPDVRCLFDRRAGVAVGDQVRAQRLEVRAVGLEPHQQETEARSAARARPDRETRA